MAKVWIMVDASGDDPDEWKSNVKAVVLSNKKILAKTDSIKSNLEETIAIIQESWEEGNSGDIPVDNFYEALDRMNQSPWHLGGVVSSDEAREYVKLSGGI